MWQNRLFLLAGALAAVMLGMTAFRSFVGLATVAPVAAPLIDYKIPAFRELVECDAHFSNTILQINSGSIPKPDSEAMTLLHRNYRRLHRLMRQVCRRDGIAPEEQTSQLRQRVNQLHNETDTVSATQRDRHCRAMAAMPIARSRHSQRIVGR
ncbi:MAG: hypothetical protein KKB37_14635 [Alphaproteobacteria bacterium]|nr:hypothetical protein [Alphaproteobacteria bacterium]